MSDSKTRFVICAALFTIFSVGGVIYLFSAYLSYSLPFQQWGPEVRHGEVQNKTVANNGASDTQTSTGLADQRDVAVISEPVSESSDVQNTPPVAEEPLEPIVSVADDTTASLRDNTITIKAFKATMFSDLTDDASEVAVNQGAHVKVLEKSGNWVKIEMVQGGAVGYVHSSNFGDLNALTADSNKASDQKSYRIMALGDSITEGVSGEKSYRNSLATLLDNSTCEYAMVGGRAENKVATDFSSPHEGYTSHRVDYFLNEVEGNPGIDSIISSHRPNVLLVHLGSVDMYVDQSVESTVQELDELITRIWNIDVDVEVYMANVIPWFGVSSSNKNIGEDSAALTLAIGRWVQTRDDPRLHLVNVNSDYVETYMQADGIHPNAEGEAFLANTFLSSLRANGMCPAMTAK